MNVYKRFFRVTSGPLIDAIIAAKKTNDAARDKYRSILNEIGAASRYYAKGERMVGIVFDKTPDASMFKRLPRGGYWPKRNCKEGKAIHDRISAIKTSDVQTTLKTVGLNGSAPVLFSGGYAYWNTIVVIPEQPPVAYVCVPWQEVDPAVMDEYCARKKEGTRSDTSYDFLQWEPTSDMEEVKQWERDRHIDEWNSRIDTGDGVA